MAYIVSLPVSKQLQDMSERHRTCRCTNCNTQMIYHVDEVEYVPNEKAGPTNFEYVKCPECNVKHLRNWRDFLD